MEQLQQGTSEWLAWRQKGIGASEIPMLMGESDFATPYQLWERKTGRAKEQETNFAMQRGTNAEPKIRALYELINDKDMPPILAQHPGYPFLRASLDGFNQDERRVLEIKYPGKEKHELAKSGKIPPCYYGQVQAQMFVIGAKQADYVSYDGEKIEVVPVEFDQSYIDKMLPVAKKFWECVEKDEAPELIDRDFKLLRGAEDVALFQQWKTEEAALESMKASIKEATDRLEAIKKQITDRVKDNRVRCAGVKFTRIFVKGNVDYAKIPQLKGVDLEQFRKKPSTRVSLKIEV